MSSEAIADTSFLIDWARYSGRDVLYQVFRVVYIPESVLREVRSPPTIDWIAEGLAVGKLALFTETPTVEVEARRIMSMSLDKPLRRIDYPEAVCLVAGVLFGYVVLTENGGAYYAPRVLRLGVTVWRAFEVIVEAWRRGHLEDLEGELKKYEEEAAHVFKRRDWEYVWELTRSGSGKRRQEKFGERGQTGNL